jgi:hypothetical protein
MNDPWLAAADQLRRDREATQAATAREAEERRAAQERERVEAEERHRIRNVAIEVGITKLEQFMRERGAAAQTLLAAYNDKAHVMFGCDSGGGFYHSVYLDAHGIREEGGTHGGYGGHRQGEPTQATARKAVEYFADYGAGKDKPDLVRNIDTWLTQQVESYARRR